MDNYMRDYLRHLVQDYVSGVDPNEPIIQWDSEPEVEKYILGMMETAYNAGVSDCQERLE